MRQITKGQAVEIYESKEWKNWTDEEIVTFQLFQQYLAIPFTRFHQAMEKILGRPVWTHEFAFIENLRAEYRKERPAPSFADIINLIPKEKRILVGLGMGER